MIIKHKDEDVTRLVNRIEWSGSRLQAARCLTFDMVQDGRDTNLPNHPIDNGETVYGYDEENNLVFQGNVFRVEKDVQASKVSIRAMTTCIF